MMWQIDHAAETDLAPEAIWGALIDLETGAVPLRNGDRLSLIGPFTVGATIAATPVGLDPLESTITELEDNHVLAAQTPFNGLVLLLRHTLHRESDGGTRIVRHLEITGPDADQQGPVAGPRISADYPEALDEIIAIARARI